MMDALNGPNSHKYKAGIFTPPLQVSANVFDDYGDMYDSQLQTLQNQVSLLLIPFESYSNIFSQNIVAKLSNLA